MQGNQAAPRADEHTLPPSLIDDDFAARAWRSRLISAELTDVWAGRAADEILVSYSLAANDAAVRRVTFAQLDSRVAELVVRLTELGVQKDTHVALWAHNCVEWVEVYLACLRLGTRIAPRRKHAR